MKLSSFAKAAVCGAGVLCGAGALMDNLLVHRKFELPESLKVVFTGQDMSETRVMAEDLTARLEAHGYERHTIVNDAGQRLTGYLLRPEQPSNIYVLCTHGYRCNGKREFCGFLDYYLSRGINLMIVDNRAAGESEGERIGFGYFESRDGLLWLDYLNATFGSDISLILHGVSMGSATAMLMTGASTLPENVKLTIADCGYTSAWDEFEAKLEMLKFPSRPLLPFVNAVNKILTGYDFKEDTSALNAVKNAKIPMLFVHGTADGFVPCEMVYRLFEACASEHKQLLLIEGAQHAGCIVTDPAAYEGKMDEMIDNYVREKAE